MTKHKGNHSREGVFISDKTQVDFHKTSTKGRQFLLRIANYPFV